MCYDAGKALDALFALFWLEFFYNEMNCAAIKSSVLDAKEHR